MSFDDFIILKRIAKNNEEYILQVLELNTFQKGPIFYNRENEKIRLFPKMDESFLDTIIKEFIHYETSEQLTKEYLIETLEISIIKLDINLKIHRFDRKTRPAVRKFHYSIKNNESKGFNSLFIPCCGKHLDHENIKTLWGKYINNYELINSTTSSEISPILIEGYQVFDIKAFDTYITHLGPAILEMRYIGNSGILLKELLDYVEAIVPLTESDPVISIKYSSGREIELL
jgi:hypothetical protein